MAKEYKSVNEDNMNEKMSKKPSLKTKIIICSGFVLYLVILITLILSKFLSTFNTTKGKSYITKYSECDIAMPFTMIEDSYNVIESNGKTYVQFYAVSEYYNRTVFGTTNINKTYENGILNVTYDWVTDDYEFQGCVFAPSYCYVYFTVEVDDGLQDVYVNDEYLPEFIGGFVTLLDENYEPIRYDWMNSDYEFIDASTDVNSLDRNNTFGNETIMSEDKNLYHLYTCWRYDDLMSHTVLTDDTYNIIFETDFEVNEHSGYPTSCVYAGDNQFLCNTLDGIVKVNNKGEIVDKLSGYLMHPGEAYSVYGTRYYDYFLIYNMKYQDDNIWECPQNIIGRDLHIILSDDVESVYVIPDASDSDSKDRCLRVNNDVDGIVNYTLDGKRID